MAHKSVIVLKAMAAAYIVTILLLSVVAFVMYKVHLADHYAAIIINVVYVAANFAGGMICAKAMNSRRMIWGAITAVGYFIILYALSLLIGGEELKEMIEVAQMAAFCLIGGILGGLLS